MVLSISLEFAIFMSILKITRIELIIIFFLYSVLLSIYDGMSFFTSCYEQVCTLIHYNYFERNKNKILDIAKNKNFHHYKNDNDISIVFVNKKAKMAYIYQIRNILFERREVLMMAFDDGVYSFYERTVFKNNLEWDFLDYIIDFADTESKIKNGHLSSIVLHNFNTPNNHYYFVFRKKIKKIMSSLNFKLIRNETL